MATIQEAYNVYAQRHDRMAHPHGTFDRAGRWYPGEEETCDCCSGIRCPSRAYPYGMMTHCRTLKHVATLMNVSEKELKAYAKVQERK